MPQLKVGHLRALPAIPENQPIQQLERLAVGLAERNTGISEDERRELDALVFRAFGLSPVEQARVQKWAERYPPPRSRSRAAA